MSDPMLAELRLIRRALGVILAHELGKDILAREFRDKDEVEREQWLANRTFASELQTKEPT